ncbi:hypothetical protein GGX14DRAFT_641230, partial [Mycena pura]
SVRTSNSSGSTINPVQSACLTTFASGKLRYGHIEVRAMPVGDRVRALPPLDPAHNATQRSSGHDSVYGDWPCSGEIDIIDSRGNGLQYTNCGANLVQSTLNWGPSIALNSVGKSYSYWGEKRKLFSSDFHTY